MDKNSKAKGRYQVEETLERWRILEEAQLYVGLTFSTLAGNGGVKSISEISNLYTRFFILIETSYNSIGFLYVDSLV